MGPGENAGAVDAGDGLAVAFKVESHNHPSAVEPFQGAATGVGGILRDVFALGARPIAVLDSLRFGDSRHAAHPLPARAGRGRHRRLRELGRRGDGRRRDLLRAALRAELPRQRDVRRPRAGGPADALRRRRDRATCWCCSAPAPGRDGIGGASVLASAELDEGDEDKRPSVQIGDPLEESKLIECCLELVGAELLVALQDLGAAGLSSSTSEMASKGEVGLDLDVSRVPLREPDMEPFEIMISESQERMLCVVEPRGSTTVLAVCARWETHATPIGEVTDTRRLRVFDGDELVGDMPVTALVDECPLYDLEPARARGPRWRPSPRSAPRWRPTPSEQDAARAARLARNVASRRWVFEQYDCLVGSRTVRRPEQADAAVLKLACDGQRHRQRARRLDRRQRAARRLRSLHRRRRGGLRVRRQPRLRRRGAARPHQLPQLRQSREAPRRLAADARRRGHGGRLPRARRPGRGRQRLALQRGARGPDLPDAGRRHGRRAAGRRPRPGPARFRLRRRRASRHGRAGRPVRPVAAGLRAGASSTGELAGGPAAVRPRRRARGARARARGGAGGSRHERARRLRGRPRLRRRRVRASRAASARRSTSSR